MGGGGFVGSKGGEGILDLVVAMILLVTVVVEIIVLLSRDGGGFSDDGCMWLWWCIVGSGRFGGRRGSGSGGCYDDSRFNNFLVGHDGVAW